MSSPEYKLESVSDVFNGKTPSKSEQRDLGHPVLKIKDVTEDGKFLGTFDSFVDEDLAQQFKKKQVQIGDILILNAAHSANYVGSKVYRAEKNVVGALATGEWLIIRPFADKLDPKYAYYWVISGHTRHLLRQLVKGIHLYPRDVQRLRLRLSSLPEQRCIAAILDKADTIRRKRKEASRLTDTFLSSAFMKMVGPASTDYDTWPEASIESLAYDSKGSMRTGPFGSDLRHSEFVDQGVAVLGIDNAVNNRFAWAEKRFITKEKYSKLKRYTISPGDVIVTIMGTTGRSAVVPTDVPLAITTKHLAAITLNRKLAHPEFISYSMHTHPQILQQIKIANRGAIMSGLNLTIIKKLKLRLPPLALQERFAMVVSKVRSTQENLQKMNDEAANLFNSLVQRSFRGEL